MKKGIFITLEGPDGSGKTTIATLLKNELENRGYTVVHTREPGGVRIAEKIRDIILDPLNTAMDARTEALLYAASRRQHLVEKVIPALEKGESVLCERFLDSSLAYQGYGRQIGALEVLAINRFAIEGTMPDITLYLSIDEEEGLKRIADRPFKDRLDSEALSFHTRVREGYEEIIKQFKDRIVVIDASNDKETVLNDCLNELERFLKDA